ncbi:SON protein [Gregarina niphandrodes]|uniref:SON protein n=1 Tax=Gregarina niphandrodes TaxID=110365 RepID=A0A023B790_GRENI|nr:SON protein [Gregarina niphandrodes]EZG67071.1 SON protein [Gregarina niphandrodes]|eukprot:XP_011130348.1 SON protein [Gregarina niphandrodes]
MMCFGQILCAICNGHPSWDDDRFREYQSVLHVESGVVCRKLESKRTCKHTGPPVYYHLSVNDDPHRLGDDPHPVGDDPHRLGDDPHRLGDDPHRLGDDPHRLGDDPHRLGDDPHRVEDDDFVEEALNAEALHREVLNQESPERLCQLNVFLQSLPSPSADVFLRPFFATRESSLPVARTESRRVLPPAQVGFQICILVGKAGYLSDDVVLDLLLNQVQVRYTSDIREALHLAARYLQVWDALQDAKKRPDAKPKLLRIHDDPASNIWVNQLMCITGISKHVAMKLISKWPTCSSLVRDLAHTTPDTLAKVTIDGKCIGKLVASRLWRLFSPAANQNEKLIV